MAAGSLSIIPKLIQLTANGTIVTSTTGSATPTVNGSSVFAGMEVEGRAMTINVDEVQIEDGQNTQTRYIAEWEMFIEGTDALTATATNKPETSSYVKKQLVVYGAVGTLGVALNDVYVFAEPNYEGSKIRTKIKCRKEFLQSPDTTNSPVSTFTVTA